jgi:hypothetical protein
LLLSRSTNALPIVPDEPMMRARKGFESNCIGDLLADEGIGDDAKFKPNHL